MFAQDNVIIWGCNLVLKIVSDEVLLNFLSFILTPEVIDVFVCKCQTIFFYLLLQH